MPERDFNAREAEGAKLVDEAAARWALRVHDGLTADEEAELAAWLSRDHRHPKVFAEHQAAWTRFAPLADTAAGEPLQFETHRSRAEKLVRVAGFVVAGAAAALAVVFWWGPAGESVAPKLAAAQVAELLPPCERRVLADGSVVELNRGAAIAVEYSATVRSIRLVRGEASFSVEKDPARPFVVTAGAVAVRALGTAFNVRHAPGAVEVLVTHGTVSVEPTLPDANAPASAVVLVAEQQAIVPTEAARGDPAVARLTTAEIDRRLAWQSRFLQFDDAPLGEIVDAFNRHNPVAIAVEQPSLAALRMTASFRSDNVEGFIRLLEANYGIRASRRADGMIALARN